MFQSINNETVYNYGDIPGKNEPENKAGYQPYKIINSQTEGSGFVDYDEGNGTCSECEDFCGLTCYPVCLLFQDSDCQIPEPPLNHSGISIFEIMYSFRTNSNLIYFHITFFLQTLRNIFN